jgi:molybdopterin-guanine dinucleotide biosynthesis protein A
VIGCVLAGGLGRRLGAPKAAAELAGRALISYPLTALEPICERVAVVCKRDTELPPLSAERWDEPDEPQHPIAGIVYALERAGGPVLVCAADMPFVTPDVCALVAAALGPGRAAAVAYGGERLQPLLAAYAPEGLEVLRSAPEGEPLTRTVEALEPVRVDVDADVVFNVNTPDDLAEAERRLRSGSSEARP